MSLAHKQHVKALADGFAHPGDAQDAAVRAISLQTKTPPSLAGFVISTFGPVLLTGEALIIVGVRNFHARHTCLFFIRARETRALNRLRSTIVE